MDLLIRKKNEVYLKVEAQPHINYELADFFTFEVESAKYMQKTKRYKGWDGKIRLFSPATGEIYCGLIDYLVDWIEEKKYNYNNSLFPIHNQIKGTIYYAKQFKR